MGKTSESDSSASRSVLSKDARIEVVSTPSVNSTIALRPSILSSFLRSE
jgi:hypothetical protein